jgi:REP element-mobilizing transposase RayT
MALAQSLAKIILHIVFSTKNRNRWLKDSIRPELFAFIAGACKKAGSKTYRVGGTEDHIHIACTLPRTLALSKLLEEIKRSSSAWIKKQDDHFKLFAWQAGYGAFSLGKSQLPQLLGYIDKQHEHHRVRTFKDELQDLLDLYNVEYDERYLWD